jgi:Ca-activated chloride channel homolog
MSSRRLLSYLCVVSLAGCTDMDDDPSSVGGPTSQPPSSYFPPPVSPQASPPVARSEQVTSNPFVLTESDPFSTFAADVDTASYDIFRRSLLLGALPLASEVRAEEYINYFHYDYPLPEPDSEVPFTISLAASAHVAGASTKVLRVGIQAAELAEKGPTNLVFLVDISGSMVAPNKLPLVQRVLKEALTVLDPADTVSIVTYAGSTGVALAPTAVRERAKIEAVIARLESGGGTNGSSGIRLAYQQAKTAFLEDGINHVVLCTDGDFNLGVTDHDALVALIERERESGVTLTALGVGERNNDAMMERVSNAGNGMYSVLYNEDQAIAYTHRRLLSTMLHVAKDVKLQVEFNPEHVHAYRLIGYEDRALADDQFRDDRVDAGEIGSGHQVTALFELALEPGDLAPGVRPLRGELSDVERVLGEGELVRVSVRWKRPGAAASEEASELDTTLGVEAIARSVEELDPEAAWAMGVAALAESLRGSLYAPELDLAGLRAALEPLASNAERAELISLWPQVERLTRR